MFQEQDSGYLQTLKSQLRSTLNEPVARLANAISKLETLQNKGDSLLPSHDAAAFRTATQQMIFSIGRSRELLIAAQEQAEDIHLIQVEERDE